MTKNKLCFCVTSMSMSLWIRYQYEKKTFLHFFYLFSKQHNPIEELVSQASETNNKIKTRKKNIIFWLTRLPDDDNVCFQLCRIKLNTSDCPSDYIYIYTFQSRWFQLSSYAVQNTKHMRVHHTILYCIIVLHRGSHITRVITQQIGRRVFFQTDALLSVIKVNIRYAQ